MRARACGPMLAGAAMIAAACASPGIPPGGPERHTAPMITRIRPDTNALNVRAREMTVDFDEVINERPGGGAANLSDLVIISPRDGAPRVDWHRDAITISQRHGFRKNTAYTVTILPGIGDLHGNMRSKPIAITFSTGPSIPPTVLSGRMFDWVTGEPASTGIVEARPGSDTTVTYVAVTDSLGGYRLRGLPPAQYRVRGFIDRNANRGLDPSEAFDTAGVTVTDSVSVELLAFAHDSTGPVLSAVTLDDSVTLRANFLTPLDPRVTIAANQFVLTGPDSARVAVVRVAPASPDTARATPLPRNVTPQEPSAVPVPIPQGPGHVAVPKPSRPLLVRDVLITLARPLRTGTTYRLQVTGMRGPTGKTANSERTFQVPKPEAPADTTRRRPATTRPRTTPPSR